MQISPWWYPAPDAVYYLSIARSLVRHHHLATLENPQLGFPPGYPLLVSPAFVLSDRPFLVVSVIHLFLAIALMVGTYRWARRWSPDGALLVTALVMVNVSFWIHYRRVLSEVAFMTCMVWSVHALNAVVAAPSRRDAFRRAVPAAALLVAVCMIREVGVVIAGGFALALLLEARRDNVEWWPAVLLVAAVGLPAAATVVGFIGYEAAMRATSPAPVGTHLEGLLHTTAPLVPQLVEGVRLRVSEVGRLLIPGMFKSYARRGVWLDVNLFIYVPVFALVALGWWKFVRRCNDVFALTLPFYLAAYVVWSYDSGTRYMLPMLPVLAVCLWSLLDGWRRHRLTIVTSLLVAHLGVAAGYWLAIDLPRARACSAGADQLSELVPKIPVRVMGTGGADVPACERWLLAFALDRPVLQVDQARLADVDWMVVPTSWPEPAGYRRSATAGQYQLLLKRRTRTAATPAEVTRGQ